MKGGVQKGEKPTQNLCNERSLKSANDTTGEDLQLDLEIEVGFEQDKPLELGSLTTATVQKHLS